MQDGFYNSLSSTGRIQEEKQQDEFHEIIWELPAMRAGDNEI